MTPETIEKAIYNPDFIINLATKLKDEQAKTAALTADNETMKPKALFADAVATSHTSILIGDLAKLIRQNGVDIGQNRLFGWLRDNGYLIGSGDRRNMPTQRAMDLELLEVKERTFQNPDGSVRITKTTKVTGKGQQYFINKFLQGE
jgi:anti-repressor protein